MLERASKLKILVVEDDSDTRFLLDQQLGLLGYEAVLAAVEVIITDIGLPGQSGLAVLRWVREHRPGCEVVMLTGNPSVEAAIVALRDGAVDFLTKPVTREMLTETLERVEARLRAARQRAEALTMLEAGLRHFNRQPPGQTTAATEVTAAVSDKQYHIGPVLLDLARFVIEVNGKGIDATPSEIEILHYLCRNPGRAIPAHEMVESIRGYRVDPRQAPDIIRPHISNLRRKLMAADANADADVVVTVRGAGYMLKPPVIKGQL